MMMRGMLLVEMHLLSLEASTLIEQDVFDTFRTQFKQTNQSKIKLFYNGFFCVGING